MRLRGSVFLAIVAVCAVVGLMAPPAARAQTSANSLLLGTITADGQPALGLRTVLTVTSNGAECGNTIPQGGIFSMLLSCPAGPAYVNVNGVPVAAIQVAPLMTITVHLTIPANGAPTPIATAVPPASPTPPPSVGTPRAPMTGNTQPAGGDGMPGMALLGAGVFVSVCLAAAALSVRRAS